MLECWLFLVGGEGTNNFGGAGGSKILGGGWPKNLGGRPGDPKKFWMGGNKILVGGEEAISHHCVILTFADKQGQKGLVSSKI